MSLIAIRGGLSDPVSTERLQRITAILPDREVALIPDDETLHRRAHQLEICFGKIAPRLVQAAPSLRWVQWDAAGVNQIIDVLRHRRVILTNASGIHGIPIAEHILGMMLVLARNLDYSIRLQLERRWERIRGPSVFELHGKRVLLLGVGAIGTTVAAKMQALGMEVVGVRRDASTPHPTVEQIVPIAKLHSVLPTADFVVITLPHTETTDSMMGVRELELMKDSAYLVNVGRGGIVDETALVEALNAGPEAGGIAGAAFDVFAEEPLPADHPLRDARNLLITPHYAGWTPHYAERLWEIFLSNAQRYVEGRPLNNVIDLAAGY